MNTTTNLITDIPPELANRSQRALEVLNEDYAVCEIPSDEGLVKYVSYSGTLPIAEAKKKYWKAVYSTFAVDAAALNHKETEE